MKKILMLFISLTACICLHSEPKITIGIVMPDEADQIDAQSLNILKAKMISMMSNSGVSCMGGSFVMYPVINITNEVVSEGGMQTLIKEYVDVTFSVVEYDTKNIFSSKTISLKGVGARSKGIAIRNAFNSIKTDDPAFNDFISTTISKIEEYYRSHKDIIIRKAKALAVSRDYEEAIAILNRYPSEVEGSEDVNKVLLEIYHDYALYNCTQMVDGARAAMSINDYDTAAGYLANVDSNGPCGKEAKAMEEKISQKIADEKQFERNMEEKRLRAAKEIADAYYKRTWPQITYSSLLVI